MLQQGDRLATVRCDSRFRKVSSGRATGAAWTGRKDMQRMAIPGCRPVHSANAAPTAGLDAPEVDDVVRRLHLVSHHLDIAAVPPSRTPPLGTIQARRLLSLYYREMRNRFQRVIAANPSRNSIPTISTIGVADSSRPRLHTPSPRPKANWSRQRVRHTGKL